tara:strand:- start:577 stop:837 length:261 start_codon:yes stop_codon:yes gene_type:complete
MNLNKYARRLEGEYAPVSIAWKLGDIITHPSGRTVKLGGGAYWGTYGVSNHWEWNEVFPDGSLGPREHGYGWNAFPLEKPAGNEKS